ncbi:helix-turn-helix transcriptional regulator [Streptomyces sp. ISL-100]|uniref:helix-turn-helix transcriptional regulator n=1 Tax=Streptomyces sp. ISL-100 TaxID=2819173 RepID=UPI001BEB5CBE|nr:helix-turn-helix transcriptional regulator [Streptomyces sp. ISL-100]MBT2399328.1 helix-turn-helix transcriptional regulator [Streptomyces sp. ISL-100]
MLLQANINGENASLETLSKLVGRQQRALVEAGEVTRSLQLQLSALALHHRGTQDVAVTGVEEIDDPGRVRALLDSVAAMTRHQIRVIQPSVVARHLISDWLGEDRYGHENSIEVRTIHQSSLLHSERAVSYLERLARRGVRVRVAPLLPFRLIMVDETSALVCPPDTTLLVRQPALLQLLARMFEFCWDDARDLYKPPAETPHRETKALGDPAGVGRVPLSEQQLVILRLWAKGRQDPDIACELRVSPRTLRRMVSALLRRLGVSSRFEAGVVAARTHQLLEDTERLPLPF